ncbi:helix-turn-helix domain-containing protein [Spirochaeta africana]|uniref:Response regulator containing CheY-like receiver domain and AraC-type DNA-binding domain n=1 Tax=Spirochaeta africana (strain ATCC 700263 / DSM 8902 / Z-7692) TaxID=889378 RepID=H9UFT7_SPIAZ|nr:helix-turn-helix domain-containing protein [Spirochaeta africana]AFG36380.1 response regulator containing CheY-like receiver domain and AraC-type DNA-binding domain [Spirochaeta africana DSM 8902]
MSRRIYVIDDELPVLEGVTHIVETAFPEGEICGSSRSGITALQQIDQDPPDILLVDIHLPGISGLEIVNDVRRRHPGVLCIIISAYEQFSIAKEALDFGVFAYIVKPVTKRRLLQVLQGACDELDRGDRLHAADLAGKALRQSVDGLLELQLVPRLFSGVWRPDAECWDQWLTALRGVRPDFFPAVVAAYVECTSPGCGTRIAAALRYKLPCWTGVTDGGAVGVLVSGEQDGVASSLREAVREAMYISGTGFAAEPVLRCSEPVPLERIWAVLPGVLPARPETAAMVPAAEALRASMQQLWGIVRSLEKTALDSWEQEALPRLELLLQHDHDFAVDLLLEPVFAAYQPPQLPPPSVTSLRHQGSAREMLRVLITLVQRAAAPGGYRGVSRSLQEALEYLRLRYHEQVSLESAAAAAGVSAAHLSRLFRQELQLSFSDYLTSLRMERAQQLLSDTNRSIKEVGHQVGYQDANYFSRVFKRWVGVTPREYAGSSGQGGEDV